MEKTCANNRIEKNTRTSIPERGKWVLVINRSIRFGDMLQELILGVLIVYEGWYIEKFEPVPLLLQGLALLLVVFYFFNMGFKKIKISSPGFEWFLFGFFALVGALTQSYAMQTIDPLITYASFWVVCICAETITDKKESMLQNWIVLVTLLCIVSVFADGYLYKNGGYYGITMGPDNNPNTLGLIMAIGSFYLLNPKGWLAKVGSLIRIALVLVCLVVVVQTGSRSGFLCYLVVIAFSLFNYAMAYGKGDIIKMLRLLLVFALVGLCLFFLINCLPKFAGLGSGDGGINRIIDKLNSGSFTGRTVLYVEAWELFKENPIFGVGYKCFSLVSSFNYFTHSTYMELLSCTGIVGFVLFLAPVLVALIKAFKNRKQDNGRVFTIIVLFLASGFFGIIYYQLLFMLVLYIEMRKVLR